MKRFFISLIEILEVALVAVGSVFLIRNFLLQPFLVSGESMVPSFLDGDYLLIDELTYRFRTPERGEVAVFRYPNDHTTFFIKRIIGLPGDRVVVKDGRVNVFDAVRPDGLVLMEQYLSPGTRTSGEVDTTLEPDEYFVLGDNRSYSFDSRTWGSLDSKDIVGLVRLRLWPLSSFRAFAAPEYSR